MRRRYTDVRNPIERLRQQAGLGDLPPDSVPVGQGPTGMPPHPLPLTGREPPAPWTHPLPLLPDRPLYVPPQNFESGTTDWIARQRGELAHVPKGGVEPEVSVYPAWESRLVAMRDFLAPTLGTSVSLAPATVRLSAYVVPQGYTAFWKTFRFYIHPVPSGCNVNNTLLTLLVDDQPVPDYFNLPVGPSMQFPQDCWIIAGEGRRLQLEVRFTEAVGDLFGISMWGMLYGNLRVRTGEGEAQEAGVRAPPPVVVAPPVLPQVAQPAAPVQRAAPMQQAPAPQLAPQQRHQVRHGPNSPRQPPTPQNQGLPRGRR